MLVTYVRQCTFASGLILSPGGFDGRNHSTDRRGARRRIRLSDSRATIGTVDTFHALHEHDHNLAAYCATSERWAVLDLERLIAVGRGEHFLSVGSRAVTAPQGNRIETRRTPVAPCCRR